MVDLGVSAEFFPAAAPSCDDPSVGPWRWFSAGGANLLHASGKSLANRLLFLLATRGAAEDYVSSLWRIATGLTSTPDALASSRPEATRPQTVHLAARRCPPDTGPRAGESPPDLLAHQATVHHPDAPRLAVLTFHHAQNDFHRRDIARLRQGL